MKTSPLTSRERVGLVLSHREPDRLPKADTYWNETVPLWRKEGFPPGVEAHDYFDHDILRTGWINHRADPSPPVILEERDEWEIRRDGNGAILRHWKNRSGTPEHIGFTVDSPESWERLKTTLREIPPSARVDLEAARMMMEKARQGDRWFCWGGIEAFEAAKDVTGHETLCLAMAEKPDWVWDLFATHTRLSLSVLDYLEGEGLRFDGGWIFGDIAYNHGPFFSPAMYRRLLMPHHAAHIDWFKRRGLPVIYHTDGDFRPLIPALLETGVDCLQPLEAKAGMDVRELKPLYGDRVSFMGNIDVMVLLTNNREKIELEVSGKIKAANRRGGYVYHSDHSIPPGVRLDTYEFVMDLVNRPLG